MKKVLIHFFIFLFPLFTFAQTESYKFKDFVTKTKGIVSSFTFNESVGIFQIQLSDKNFEMMAVDNKMQLLWEAQFEGNGVACGKFKGNILAIADSGFSSKKKWAY